MIQDRCPPPATRSARRTSGRRWTTASPRSARARVRPSQIALFVRDGRGPILAPIAARARPVAFAVACLAALACVACNDMLGLTAPSLKEPDSHPPDSSPGTWQSDMPALSAGRALHTASLLPNGDVALFGGCDSPSGSPIDVLSRVSPDHWERLEVESDVSCLFGQAAALDAQGRAVVAGGFRQGILQADSDVPTASTDALEYNLSESSLTPGALAPSAGYWTATPFGDGRVLFAGGSSEPLSTLGTSLASVRGSFDESGAYLPFFGASDIVCTPENTKCMLPRTFHTATLLGDGSVLLAGGRNGDEIVPTAARYLPSKHAFEPAGDMPSPRWLHAATLLADGRVLLCGGNGTTGASTTVQIFDPDNPAPDPDNPPRLCDAARNMNPPFCEAAPMQIRRSGHTATLLGDGRVLVAGGSEDRRAELYDPKLDTWTFTPEMAAVRHLHTATLLGDGSVLVAGGQESASPIPFDARATVERYVP